MCVCVCVLYLYFILYVCAPLAGKNGFADYLEEINNQSINQSINQLANHLKILLTLFFIP